MADKITQYMRMTKRKTPEKEKGTTCKSPSLSTISATATQSSRAPAPVAAKEPAPTSTSHEPQQHHQYYHDEDHVPEFIYKVLYVHDCMSAVSA